jgi:hypothetical protein
VQAPAGTAPIEAITHALTEIASVLFEERRELVRQRQAIIAGNTEPQECEVIKLALVAALARALRERGVGEPAASPAGEAGLRFSKLPSKAGSAIPASGPWRSSSGNRRRAGGSDRRPSAGCRWLARNRRTRGQAATTCDWLHPQSAHDVRQGIGEKTALVIRDRLKPYAELTDSRRTAQYEWHARRC